MKILYGVCGEGMGHAVRSSVVGAFLEKKGHEVQFVCSSGRARDFLAKRFSNVVRGVGVETIVRGNEVQPFSTFVANAAFHVLGFPFLHSLPLLGVTTPDVVISDFDAWSASYAKLLGKRLIAIDNIHFISRCQHPREFISSSRSAAAFAYAVTHAAVRDADHYLITSFAGAPITQERTSLHLPILRPEVAMLRGVAPQSHVVAYFNDKIDSRSILQTLGQVSQTFHVYGLRGCPNCAVPPNVSIRPMSDDFLIDLASSKAVIGGGGFTLMTESIYLQKPLLAFPIKGQFEQELNASYLQGMGFGERLSELSAPQIEGFLSRTESYRSNLQAVRHDGNAELFATLEGLLQ